MSDHNTWVATGFDPGDPITSGDLIEDEDGAPLPHELQPGGRIADTIWQLIGTETSNDEWAVDLHARLLIALAPVLWPLLPSNDHNAWAEWAANILAAIKAVPRRSGTPEWSKGGAVAQAAGYDMGLAAAVDAARAVQGGEGE